MQSNEKTLVLTSGVLERFLAKAESEFDLKSFSVLKWFSWCEAQTVTEGDWFAEYVMTESLFTLFAVFETHTNTHFLL